MIGSIFFILLVGVTSWHVYKQSLTIIQKIQLGKNDLQNDHAAQRWNNVLLVAFGQKKMFKNMIPAVLHGFIYVAFLFTQIELIEIIIDGVFGTHRFFAPFMGGFYTFLISVIEILSVLALIATFAFLARRNLLKVPRLVKSELNGWPKLDANLILIGEFLLVCGIFTMNGTYAVLQQLAPETYHYAGNFAVSSWLGPALFGGLDMSTLAFLERVGWWLHLLIVLGFLWYLPISKHLHIILAFPNVFYAKLRSRGEMENMPEIMNEVKSMFGLPVEGAVGEPSSELPQFGAKDITDLSDRNLLNAYSCTECGRCTAECPANITGKKLSPRKIMMDVRDRADEVFANKQKGITDEKSLFDYISREEIRACTTCNACVEACPLMIDPLDIILQMRRYEILTESSGPGDWVPMFTSLENSGSVWQIPQDRDAWTRG